ncbi:MAG: cytochrome b558/566 subunit B [Saccharolobus sp.]|uniref:Cytochrome b558/566 subunit B n=1 Tax=Saccharolobus shibatae (strain ATCC 51178 / DSM 5389 / JCM 8931 / NBRC 15437 / B12) TaxID=523848 RepID=A0A8F5GSY0_SACSH|nr:cytochrome b558/566 subunit B [Saccharolobus shibatae]MCH4815737.1 cytochrome b558/566 subunit B [Saccharolobus shibatae]QXJ27797.1 Cytochrome b558/566, subunit B (CbsB) [Saccharolobus shibatae B12]
MKIVDELKGNLNLFLILLGIFSLLQFSFKQAFMFPSILPLNIPNANLLLVLGNISFYFYFVFLLIVSIILSFTYKSLIPITVILLVSPFITLIPNYENSFLVYSLEMAILILGLASTIEGLIKSSLLSILLIPTLILVNLGIFASILLNIFHNALFISYLTVYLISIAGYLTYVILWGKIKSSRNYIAVSVGLLSIIPFLFFENTISQNRYLEILMNMILPSTLGITLYNPYHITLLVIALGLSIMGIVTSLIKGNVGASVGYFLIITTVFLGIDGFSLLIYMLTPIIGFLVITSGEIESKKRLIDIISPTRNG